VPRRGRRTRPCTGNYCGFWANPPLWIARYSSSSGTLPEGAPTRSFWQYSSSGPFAGDSDQWNGGLDRLKVLACNGPCDARPRLNTTVVDLPAPWGRSTTVYAAA
jgi:hypothetical protein